jgi:membrane-bound lytic murein transglycosylase D
MLTYGKSLKIISNQSVVRSVKKESDTDRVTSQAISKNQNLVAYKSTINTISAPLSTDYSTLYVVQERDSLFSIAKKHPGVTISDLKKWNGIRSEDIKPGMKLKING